MTNQEWRRCWPIPMTPPQPSAQTLRQLPAYWRSWSQRTSIEARANALSACADELDAALAALEPQETDDGAGLQEERRQHAAHGHGMTNEKMLQQTVRITKRDHPHYRETGKLTGKTISLFGKPMAEVKLDDCRHGIDGCFVSTGDIEIDRLQPRRRREDTERV
jgi:hypothetical protein